MYGNGAGYLDTLLQEAGANVKVLHNNRDPYFGGHHPEPGEEELKEAIQLVRTLPAHLGLATDGDADRFGVIDADGTLLFDEVLAILFDWHFKNTRLEGLCGSFLRHHQFTGCHCRSPSSPLNRNSSGIQIYCRSHL